MSNLFKRIAGELADDQMEHDMTNPHASRSRIPGFGSTEQHGPAGTSFGTDVEFKGTLTFQDTLHIGGHLEGTITSDSGTLTIGKDASVKAALEVGSASIAGYVEGNVTAKDFVELKGTAHLYGDVRAERMIVEDGVTFHGKTEVGVSSNKIEKLVPRTPTRSSGAKHRHEEPDLLSRSTGKM